MDLWGADSALASGLQALLDFEEGTGCIEEVFGVTFTASANPLLGFVQSTASYGAALSRQVSTASEGGLSRQVSVASYGTPLSRQASVASTDGESAKVKTGSRATQVKSPPCMLRVLFGYILNFLASALDSGRRVRGADPRRREDDGEPQQPPAVCQQLRAARSAR